MILFRVLLATLLCALACSAENPVKGDWTCTAASDNGESTAWTLIVREDGTNMTGLLTNGEAKIPLSEIKVEKGNFTFHFQVNEKPYGFEGKANGKTIEGKYAGEEASGTVRCKPSAT